MAAGPAAAPPVVADSTVAAAAVGQPAAARARAREGSRGLRGAPRGRAGDARTGRYLTFTCVSLMISVRFFPSTCSSYTHMLICVSNMSFDAAFRPMMRAMAEPQLPDPTRQTFSGMAACARGRRASGAACAARARGASSACCDRLIVDQSRGKFLLSARVHLRADSVLKFSQTSMGDVASRRRRTLLRAAAAIDRKHNPHQHPHGTAPKSAARL